MKETNSSGILCPLLTTLFVGLKLTGYIEWSWVWVLSPIWLPFAFALIIVICAILIAMVAEIVK